MHPERDWGFLRTYQSSEVSEAVSAVASVGQLVFATITQLHNFSTKASTDKQQAWLFSNKMLFTNTDSGWIQHMGRGHQLLTQFRNGHLPVCRLACIYQMHTGLAILILRTSSWSGDS